MKFSTSVLRVTPGKVSNINYVTMTRKKCSAYPRIGNLHLVKEVDITKEDNHAHNVSNNQISLGGVRNYRQFFLGNEKLRLCVGGLKATSFFGKMLMRYLFLICRSPSAQAVRHGYVQRESEFARKFAAIIALGHCWRSVVKV